MATITLDEKHFHLIEAEAAALGMSPTEFIHSLIDERTQELGEALEPDEEPLEASDEDLEDLFADPLPPGKH